MLTVEWDNVVLENGASIRWVGSRLGVCRFRYKASKIEVEFFATRNLRLDDDLSDFNPETDRWLVSLHFTKAELARSYKRLNDTARAAAIIEIQNAVSKALMLLPNWHGASPVRYVEFRDVQDQSTPPGRPWTLAAIFPQDDTSLIKMFEVSELIDSGKFSVFVPASKNRPRSAVLFSGIDSRGVANVESAALLVRAHSKKLVTILETELGAWLEREERVWLSSRLIARMQIVSIWCRASERFCEGPSVYHEHVLAFVEGTKYYQSFYQADYQAMVSRGIPRFVNKIPFAQIRAEYINLRKQAPEGTWHHPQIDLGKLSDEEPNFGDPASAKRRIGIGVLEWLFGALIIVGLGMGLRAAIPMIQRWSAPPPPLMIGDSIRWGKLPDLPDDQGSVRARAESFKTGVRIDLNVPKSAVPPLAYTHHMDFRDIELWFVGSCLRPFGERSRIGPGECPDAGSEPLKVFIYADEVANWRRTLSQALEGRKGVFVVASDAQSSLSLLLSDGAPRLGPYYFRGGDFAAATDRAEFVVKCSDPQLERDCLLATIWRERFIVATRVRHAERANWLAFARKLQTLLDSLVVN